MEIKRTINKAGIKLSGGGLAPDSFIYVGVTTGIDTNQHTIGFTGIFKASEEETDAMVLKNTEVNQRRGGIIPNIGGTVSDVCSCSEDGLTHTIDKVALIAKVDDIIAKRLGCEVSDIS